MFSTPLLWGQFKKSVILVLVEGDSDKKALEGPLSALFDEINPKYRVIFALQRKKVNSDGIELEDDDIESIDEYGDIEYVDEYDDDFYPDEDEYEWGGDITSSSFVEPRNIEVKITNRFFKPLLEKEKIYSRMLLQVIQIVDLDGAYIPNEKVIRFSNEQSDDSSTIYNAEEGVIECKDVDNIIDRNVRKSKNIDYLQSLDAIRIERIDVPYSVFFFSSNLDHFIHGEPNMKGGKVKKAEEFSQKYVFDPEGFCSFFIDDSDAAGDVTYNESWDEIKKGNNSLNRGTNIDILLKMIRSRRLPIIEEQEK